MTEFKEIAHSGGKIEFNHETDGLSQSISNSKPTACSMFQVCISYQGELLDFVPIRDIGVTVPYPQPSICAFVISDIEGMFGRSCPNCKSYFRTDPPRQFMFCPYCKIKANNVKFTTDNQKEFLSSYYATLCSAMSEKKSITIDLDEQVDDLSDNTAKWVYKETKQQTLHRCETCKFRFDILGEYGCCPSCGKLNAVKILNSKLDGLVNDFKQQPDVVVKQVISEFEAMAKDVQRCLILLPETPQREVEAVKKINFQRIFDARDKLDKWFGIELFKGLNSDDENFIKVMLGRRHILIHNGGRVDQQYLDKTNDAEVRLNQTIKVTEEEVKKLIELIRICANNLLEGVESIRQLGKKKG
jgi:hypothetical protein